MHDLGLCRRFAYSYKWVVEVNTRQIRQFDYLQSIDVVREDYDFISSVFMVLNEKLACLELVGVHPIQ